MTKRSLAILLLFLSLPLAAQAPPGVTHGPKSVAEPQIDAIYMAFVRGYEALDPAVVAGFYAEDAVYLPPGGDILRGRPAIQQSFAPADAGARCFAGCLPVRSEQPKEKESEDLPNEVNRADLCRCDRIELAMIARHEDTSFFERQGKGEAVGERDSS